LSDETTIRTEIRTRLAACLATVLSPDAVEVDPEGDPATFPGLALFDQGDRLMEREAMLERRLGDFSIEGYVQRGGGADASAERDKLHADAVAAIMVDDTLGNLVELIEPGDNRKHVARFAEAGRLAFVLDLSVQFTTLRTDPARSA
jgi:hypothetical protein